MGTAAEPVNASEVPTSVPIPAGTSNGSGTPTPAILAATRPSASGSFAPRTSALVYSSSTDGGAGRQTPSAGELAVIDEVCRGVVAAWRAQASEADRTRVMSERPFIPNDLDRTLLTDLSAGLGVYDIDEATRYALRAHFWEVMRAQT